MKLLLPLVAALCLCTSCMSVSVRKPPKFDLNQFHRIFVVQPFNENHHLDEIFADELRRAGRDASSGPLTMMPENTDAVLTYDARWTWDFKTYLIELDFELHTAHTDKKLADGRAYQPSATPSPPEVVIHRLVAKLFPPSAAGTK